MQYHPLAGPALSVLMVALVCGQTYITLRLCSLAVAIAKDNDWEMVRRIARRDTAENDLLPGKTGDDLVFTFSNEPQDAIPANPQKTTSLPSLSSSPIF